MPKPYRDQAGSGAHLHVSLVDREGRNVFAARTPRQRDAASRDRRSRRDHDDAMAIARPREFLSPLPAGSLRAAQPELGRQQPRRRVPRPARPAGEPSRRAPRRGRGCESRTCSRRTCSRACTSDSRSGSIPGPCSRATRTATGAHRSADLAGGPRRVRAQRSCASTWAMRSRICTRHETRRGEMQEFNSHIPPLDYAWYLTTS